MRGNRRAAVVLGASTLVVLVLAGSIVRIWPGDVALVSWRGGGTPDLRAPGYSFRVPWLQRVQVFPGGEVTVRATLAAASREGSAIGLPYEARAWPDLQTLLSLQRDGGRGGATAAMRALVEEQLKKGAAAAGTYDLASGAAAASILSFAKRTLQDKLGPRLEISLEKPVLPPEVRASFEKAAIYGRRVETGARIILVGIDGADWDVINALAARGKVPNLERLKSEGAWARLRSNVPTLSPLLWTTVATGKTPDRHGINDFLVIDPRTKRQVPINSTFRRAKALWNILTEAGLSSDFIAWWATWPAETIQGHLISDRVAYSTFDVTGPRESRGVVHPPEYAQVVESLKVDHASVSFAQIARFLHITPRELEEVRRAAARGGSLSEQEQSIDVLTRVVAATETYKRIGLDLLEREASAGAPARLFALYFEGVDQVNHRFAHCSPPQGPLCPDGDYRRFKDAVAEFYAYQDHVLGDILERARGATVVVMSDHGFASGAGRPTQTKPFIEGKPGLWHDLTGIFIASGPLTKRGEIQPVTLYDIAPTLLYLLGLPVPEDMPGKVLEAALSPQFVAAHPVVRVPSYEGLERPAGEAIAETDEATAQEIKEQLRALGYIGGGDETPPDSHGSAGDPAGARPEGPETTAPPQPALGPGAPPGGVPNLLYHINLGAVYLSKNQYDQAEEEFQTALRFDPNFTQALSGMAIVEEGRGNLDGALTYLRSVLGLDSEGSRSTLIKMAELFIRMGKPSDGVAYFRELEKADHRGGQRELGLQVGFGMLHAAAGHPRESETALLRALAIDPASIPAMQELFALYDREGRAAELRPAIQTALRSNPRSAMHHIWLGLVMKRKSDLKTAESEFSKAIEISPDLVGAQANLGSIYLQQGRLDEAVTVLQQAVQRDARNTESRTNLIVALGMTHDLDGARRLVKEAEAMGQRAPLFYNALAYALHVNGRSQEALDTLRESLRLDPRQPDALKLQTEIEEGRRTDGLPYR